MGAESSSRTAGTIGVVGGVIWLAALVVEYAYDLFPPGSGLLYTLDQLAFGGAILCYVVLLLGLRGSGAAGSGASGRIVPGGWAIGWVLVLTGLLLALVLPDASWVEVLPAVGGLLTAVFGLVTGILVARRGSWTGWSRWTPLALALYVIAALFVPLALGAEPIFVTEAGWALGYCALGAALVREGEREDVSTPLVGG